jgi:hypothetical protein
VNGRTGTRADPHKHVHLNIEPCHWLRG